MRHAIWKWLTRNDWRWRCSAGSGINENRRRESRSQACGSGEASQAEERKEAESIGRCETAVPVGVHVYHLDLDPDLFSDGDHYYVFYGGGKFVCNCLANSSCGRCNRRFVDVDL